MCIEILNYLIVGSLDNLSTNVFLSFCNLIDQLIDRGNTKVLLVVCAVTLSVSFFSFQI